MQLRWINFIFSFVGSEHFTMPGGGAEAGGTGGRGRATVKWWRRALVAEDGAGAEDGIPCAKGWRLSDGRRGAGA
jgi:hypothetical protein